MKSRRPVNFDVRPQTEVTNMKGRNILSVAMAALVMTIIGQATTYQEKVFQIERGEYARQIDKSIQCRIENDLRLSDLNWEVTTLAHSSTASHRLLELRKGVTRVTVSIQYLLTPDDAAKHLQFRLHMISVPRFKPLKELGEEAYVLTENGIIWFRIGKVVVEVSNGSIETQRTVADRIVASVNKGIDRPAKRVSYGLVSPVNRSVKSSRCAARNTDWQRAFLQDERRV